MKKTLYMTMGGYRYSLRCRGNCDACAVRFKCYTTKDLGLDVTQEEAFLCGRDDEDHIQYRSIWRTVSGGSK